MFTHGKINTIRVNPKPKLQPKPVIEKQDPKELTESLKEMEVKDKAEPIFKEPPKENPVVRPIREIESVQPKKPSSKKKKYKLEELMAEDQDKADA